MNDFDAGWDDEPDEYMPYEQSALPLREIEEGKQAAIDQLALLGVVPDQLSGYKALIGGSVIFSGDVAFGAVSYTIPKQMRVLPADAEIPAMLCVLCRELETNNGLSQWQMFAAGRLLGRMALAIRYPEIRKYILSEMQRNNRADKPNHGTQQLIEVCKEIRRGNAPATQKEMFETLSRRNEEWIDSETDKYGDITIWLTQNGKEPHEMKQDAFNKFEKKYREQIGRKKKL